MALAWAPTFTLPQPYLLPLTPTHTLNLPHAHRVQRRVVQYVLRAHSYLLFFVSLAMEQASYFHCSRWRSTRAAMGEAMTAAAGGMRKNMLITPVTSHDHSWARAGARSGGSW